MILFPDVSLNTNTGAEKTGNVDNSSSTQQEERTLYTKEQFTNSIMSALNKHKDSLGDKCSGFATKAASIFSSYDKHDGYNNVGADGKWQESEANSASSALAQFYQEVNNAIKGITDEITTNTESSVSDVNETSSATETQSSSDVVQAGAITTSNGTEISRAALNSITQTLKAGGVKALAEEIVGDIESFMSQGCEVTFSGNIISITNPDGDVQQINLGELISNGVVKEHVDNVADSWANKGFSEVKEIEQQDINGKQRVVVTLQNPDTGETVKIFGDTGEEIKADVNTGTDS